MILKKSRKPILKTAEEIEMLRRSAQLVSRTFAALKPHVKPGTSTAALDRIAEEFIRDHGAIPAFKNYQPDKDVIPFPGTLCTSLNEQVVHGIPSDAVILKDGDVVSLDCGVVLDGFFGDSAYTFAVGEVDPAVERLLRVTKECLMKGVAQVKRGARIGDLSSAVQQHAESNGYGVVRELVGHGVGRSLHEPPEVPNYGRRGNGALMQEGLVIAIEPMINMGRPEVMRGKDGWTIYAKDLKPSAHFEHMVALGPNGVDILTTFEYIEEGDGVKAVAR